MGNVVQKQRQGRGSRARRWRGLVRAALLVAGVALLVSPSLSSATHQSVALVNGGFEDATAAPWSGNVTRSTVRARSGVASGEVTVSFPAQATVSQDTAGVEGGTYTATAWVWLATEDDEARVEVRLRKVLHPGYDELDRSFSHWVMGTGTWQQVSVTHPAAPPETTNVLVVVRFQSESGTVGYVDDVVLSGPAPHPTPTASPSVTATASSTATATVTASAYPGPVSPTPTPTPLPDVQCLLVNEVFPRPLTGGSEWVEILNRCSWSLSTSGWTLRDNFGTTVLPDRMVGPGGLLLLRSGAGSDSAPDEVTLPGAIGNGLSNEADMVVLFAPGGVRGSFVNWGSVGLMWPNRFDGLFSPGLPAPPAGRSLARQLGMYADDPSAWNSNQAATPGYGNPMNLRMPILSRGLGGGSW